MKLAFVIYSLEMGGAERVVSLLSQYLSKEHEVTIVLFYKKISYAHGGDIIDINLPSVKNKYMKIFNVLKRAYKLNQIFKEKEFDKIFSFMETAYLPSILTGFPIVASVRNNPCVYSDFIINHILSKAERIITVSKEIENILNKNYNLKNTETILNPIIITQNYKIQEDLDKYKPYILSVGRLSKQKNFEMLINAYSKLEIKKDINLLIVGEGKERKILENLIENLNLNNNVFLVGKKENIKDYYLQSSIYVLSSSYEGFPNVLVEALSNSCACISTNCPTGPNEIIIENENGILVENENVDELSKAMEKLYSDIDLQNKFKQNAVKSIQYLSIEKIVKKWFEV